MASNSFLDAAVPRRLPRRLLQGDPRRLPLPRRPRGLRRRRDAQHLPTRRQGQQERNQLKELVALLNEASPSTEWLRPRRLSLHNHLGTSYRQFSPLDTINIRDKIVDKGLNDTPCIAVPTLF